MRVVAGTLGGRTFEAPKGHKTHPMSDKVRGALFNILGDVSGLVILDAFAGSGAVGIEALSRGASKVTFIDDDRTAAQVIKLNIQALGLQNSSKIIQANINSWSSNNADSQFDIVVCDPPYNHVQAQTLTTLTAHVKVGGIIVFSLPPQTELAMPSSFRQLTSKNYGDATLVFYRRTA